MGSLKAKGYFFASAPREVGEGCGVADGVTGVHVCVAFAIDFVFESGKVDVGVLLREDGSHRVAPRPPLLGAWLNGLGKALVGALRG